MNERTHGGDNTGNLLDFSVNVSPLGIPDAVRDALTQAAARLDRYPDPFCSELCAAIAASDRVPSGFVVCGNGASDLIFRVALAGRPKRALVLAPTFSEYEAALSLCGCDIVRYPLSPERGFRLDADFLRVLTPEIDMLFLCQPNNPTGVTVPKALLFRILERCREIDCRLILDECFLGFLDRPQDFAMQEALPDFPNLLILRAFTKLYGLAGVRLGYALCSDSAFLAQTRLCGPPWSVSTLAQAAGVAALEAKSYPDAVRRLIARERPKLYDALRALGFRVVPGEANFLLFQSPAPLEIRGILLRNCGNFRGLDNTWYRTAVRTESENRRLLSALKEAVETWRNG
ncbi:MAG: aminotransferase class I/II-fold pyridoxal phosphate-dependent enzyme [Oscillospiraceae bacterium]|nr:aminotransferase class I/II-fold pyridoxal phosphate-dependent enzyme [Oscillospiraceae bacterium]